MTIKNNLKLKIKPLRPHIVKMSGTIFIRRSIPEQLGV
jgi:hypothetical protein